VSHPRDDRFPRDHRASGPRAEEPDGGNAEARAHREQDELRAVASLLRGLPDPEPPERLVPQVLQRVAARESRPAVVRVAFGAARALAEPRAGVALAAGLACLLAVASFQGTLLPRLLGSDATDPARSARPGPDVVASGAVADGSVPVVRRPAPARRPSATVVHPQFVSFMNAYPQVHGPEGPTPRIRLGRPGVDGLERLDRRFDDRLDRQLNRLLLDPTAFYERLDGVARRDAVIARLANRAARRGDAAEIAMRLRQTDHPLSEQMVSRLLRASLVEYVSPSTR